jgi:mono/diheme cytochrome c family protein
VTVPGPGVPGDAGREYRLLRPLLALAVLLTLAPACGGGFERMQQQPRADLYEASPVFANGAVMQRSPEGTLTREADDERAPAFSMELLNVGQQRFDTVCSPCHSIDGTADTPVAERMAVRRPPPLVIGRPTMLSLEELYRVTSDGYGLMPSYRPVLSGRERWAVVAYLRALQSARAPLDALPPSVRAEAARLLEGSGR